MGQFRTYRDLYLENQISELKQDIVDYKAKNNYIYGKGAFRLAYTCKVYSKDITVLSQHAHTIIMSARFVGDRPDVGAYAYMEAVAYDENGVPMPSMNALVSRVTDVPPTRNQSSSNISALSYQSRYYLIVNCYVNSAGSVTVSVGTGSLEGWT